MSPIQLTYPKPGQPEVDLEKAKDELTMCLPLDLVNKAQ